jgi:hypothetical protein
VLWVLAIVRPSTEDGFLRYCGRQRRTDFSGIVRVWSRLPSRQRRTDFLDIVGFLNATRCEGGRASVNGRRISQVLWVRSVQDKTIRSNPDVVNEGRISQVLWAESGKHLKQLLRQRRTDFSGIVSKNKLTRQSNAYAVNGGRISQVLWGYETKRQNCQAVNGGRISQVLWVGGSFWPQPQSAPSTKDGFLRYCGVALKRSDTISERAVNEGRISQVL